MHPVMRRSLAAVALALVVVLRVAGPAAAEGTGDAWVGDGEIGAGAGNDNASPGGSGGGGGGSACTYAALDPEASAIADELASKNWGTPRGDGPGAWYRKTCPDGTGTVIWIPARGVGPAVLAQQAFDRTNIPLPGIQLNPSSSNDQVVNVSTWLWVDNFQAVSATASAGPVTVTVTARPVSLEWSMGNGDTVTCASGGTPYDTTRSPEAQRTDCTYTYRHSSASRPDGTFTIRGTSVWHVTWVASGVVASGDLGFINRSSEINVRVTEIQTVHE